MESQPFCAIDTGTTAGERLQTHESLVVVIDPSSLQLVLPLLFPVDELAPGLVLLLVRSVLCKVDGQVGDINVKSARLR
jgi:hypothetical protein